MRIASSLRSFLYLPQSLCFQRTSSLTSSLMEHIIPEPLPCDLSLLGGPRLMKGKEMAKNARCLRLHAFLRAALLSSRLIAYEFALSQPNPSTDLAYQY